MADLKQSWKQAGKSLLLALNDIGVSLFDTAKAGYDAAMDWARKDNVHVEAEYKDIPEDQSEEPAADAAED